MRKIQTVTARRTLLPTIANSLLGISRRTVSSSLKQKSQRLQETLPDEGLRDTLSFLDEPEDNNATSTGIQAHLWLLLQREMISPRAWPGWIPNILNTSKLNRNEDSNSNMLDETRPKSIIEPSLSGKDFECVSDDEDLLFDYDLDENNDFCHIEEILDSQRLVDLQTCENFAVEDDSMDEDLFWAELELDRSEKPSSEASFDDILDVTKNMNEEFSAIELDFEGCQEKQESRPQGIMDTSQVDVWTPQVLDKSFAESKDPDGFWERSSSNELKTILDDSTGIMMETLSESEEKGEVDDHEILDWSVDNSLGEELLDDILLDASKKGFDTGESIDQEPII